MGAFAITTDLVVMTLGLGIGALFVRSMTLGVVRARQSREYTCLEHGAYYAIATLGAILAASIRVQTPAILISRGQAGRVRLGERRAVARHSPDLRSSR